MNSELKKCDCGKVWKLTRHKMPYGNRDSDSLRCSYGKEVKTWSGGYTFTAEEVPTESAPSQ